MTTAAAGGSRRGLGAGLWVLLLLLGTAGWLGTRAYEDLRILREFRPAEATILAGRLSGSGRFRHPQFDLHVEAEGRTWRASGFDDRSAMGSLVSRFQAEDILAAFPPRSRHGCWFDPDDPSRVVLVRRKAWLYLLVPITGGLALAGAIAAARFAEAAAARRRREVRPRPGTVLAFALDERRDGVAVSARLAFLCVAVGAVVVPACWETAEEWFLGWPDHLLTLLISPLPLLWLAVVAYSAHEVVRRAWAAAGLTGRVAVEVSDPAPAPGDAFDVAARIDPRAPLTGVTLHLVCERDDGSRVSQAPLPVSAVPPDTLRARARLPADLSPEAASTAWLIELRGRLPLGLPCERAFLLAPPRAPAVA